MKDGISFVVPIRSRKGQVPGFLHNIAKYFKNYEIIFSCQDDNLLFRKGQLSNLGFGKAQHDIIAFINLDYRFMSKVDFVTELRKYNRPIVPFGFAARVKEKTIGRLIVVRKPLPNKSCGGCCVFTKEQFMRCNGNSNLIAGWGPDDILLRQRTNFVNLKEHTMGHIIHAKGGEYDSLRVKKRNRIIKKTDPTRDPSEDGFRQTIANEVSQTMIKQNAIEYKFRNIHVPDDFKYMYLYEEIRGK